MLDVRRLHMLRELAERETIAATAQALGYTPPAISQHLAALERQVGVALLERQGRRVTLTPAARLLVDRTERVLA
ncbi:MAG TPA: LysR family transcriptional regulator, partial [Solirubrobacteraceae bacterium]|nr:LysR family transcriptional regulator [Solirubrobacteraceae bacterium]